MIQKIDHIGIAVLDIDKALELYSGLFGIEFTGIEIVKEQMVKIAFLSIGAIKIELLQFTQTKSPISKFIQKKGEGIHHIAFRVNDIKEAISKVNKNGMLMIDDVPRYGAGGARIAFIHPKETNGVLIELCERK